MAEPTNGAQMAQIAQMTQADERYRSAEARFWLKFLHLHHRLTHVPATVTN